MFRIGIGHDTHRLARDRKLILGGVALESEFGAEGHSDADALTHAIIDAILGALARGDIGSHFPDTDARWKDADSLELLRHVAELAREDDYRIINIDSVIHLESPRLRPHIDSMRAKLADALDTDIANISVKAKTGERVDAVGEGRAVQAQAVVLLQKESEAGSRKSE